MRFAGSAPQDEIEYILGELAREERFDLALTDSGRIAITGGKVFEMAELRDTSLILGSSG